MAIPEYVPTAWVNDNTPALNSTNLNKIEKGIEDVTAEVNLVEAKIPNIVEVPGQITQYGGITPPSGWFECDGLLLNRTTYADLFNIISDRFGAGDGTTTFQLPDMRGQFVRGWDNGAGIDVDETTGDSREFGTLQDDTFKELEHFIANSGSSTTPATSANSVTFVGRYPGGLDSDFYVLTGTSATPDRGKSSITGDKETRPTNIALMYIIKY